MTTSPTGVRPLATPSLAPPAGRGLGRQAATPRPRTGRAMAKPEPLPSAAGQPVPSLAAALAVVPEPRGAQGLLHPLLPMLQATIFALLCGKQHPTGIAEWVAAHYDAWLRDALGFPQPSRPCRPTFHLFLRRLDWPALEGALMGWIRAVAEASGFGLDHEALAVDGKEARGIRRMSGEALLLVSAFTHETGLTLALGATTEGQEQEAVRQLLSQLTLTGRVVTADALHTQRETTDLILAREGDYLWTVKGNQPDLQAEIAACLAPERAGEQARRQATTREHAHGRWALRTLVARSVNQDPAALDIDWPGAAQVFCLTRTVRRGRNATCTHEVVYGITSLTAAAADPARLLRLNQGHWAIENRSHWVRDAVCGEDAGRAFLDHTAEVLAVVRTAVLSLFRLHRVKNVAAQFRRNGDCIHAYSSG